MKSHDQIQLKKFLKVREKYGDFITFVYILGCISLT